MVLLRELQARQGRSQDFDESTPLEALGLRSLDFSELALRVERVVGRELNFDAARMRGIRTVGDAVEFLRLAAAPSA